MIDQIRSIIQAIECDAELMALALPYTSKEELVKCYRDGRAASYLSQVMARNIFNLKDAPPNARGYDFIIGDQRTEMKSVTKNGVGFRESGNSGKGRTCTEDDVLRCIENVDTWILTEVFNFPIFRFIKVTSGTVMHWLHLGAIRRKNGQMTLDKFLELTNHMDVKWLTNQSAQNAETALMDLPVSQPTLFP